MSRQTWIVERFEDNGVAVLERGDGTTFDVPLEWLPEGVEEGHVLNLELSGDKEKSALTFTVQEEATARRLEEAKALRGSLAGAPEGDIDL